MILLSGSSNETLAEKVASYIGYRLCPRDIFRFADGEIGIHILKSVRGAEVFVLQSTSPPVNENLMELLIMIDALRRASAAEISVVIPYFGYARQDRKSKPREPITAKLVSSLLQSAGADRVVAVDLHAAQIQGFFDIPVDNLTAIPLFVDHIRSNIGDLSDVVIASPDIGGVKRARDLASKLGDLPLVIIDKRRPSHNVSEVMNVIGEVDGKRIILVDDIVDTAGSITAAARVLKEKGAKEVYIYATHALLSGPAIDRLKVAPVKKIVFTDTIEISSDKLFDKIEIVSVAGLIGEAIRRIRNNESVSVLFD
ncbi:MAG TPA: ribose-phosphate pyrophosphokinase [Pyrodictium sp.]|nr:ribose-phosphate pyrophosphokinase [Pyrodictium sp.]